MFCLFFDAKDRKVHALNGSGRSAKKTSLESIRKDLNLKPGQQSSIPKLSALATTVPGAAAGWCDTVYKFGSGKLSMEQILMPAIKLGENGFPVSEQSANAVSHSFKGTSLLVDRLIFTFSGLSMNSVSKMLHPATTKCCDAIPQPSSSLARLEQARSSATQLWLVHSED